MLQTVMDVSSLVVDLQNFLRVVHEFVVGLSQRLTIVQFLSVFHDLVEDRLVFLKSLLCFVIVFIAHQILNGFPMVLVLLFRRVKLFLLVLRLLLDRIDLSFKLIDVVSLSPQELGHVSFKPLDFELRLHLSHHLESVNVR